MKQQLPQWPKLHNDNPPQCHLPGAAPCPAQRPGRQGLGPSAGHPTGTANLAGVDARLRVPWESEDINGYQ